MKTDNYAAQLAVAIEAAILARDSQDALDTAVRAARDSGDVVPHGIVLDGLHDTGNPGMISDWLRKLEAFGIDTTPTPRGKR